MVYVAKRGATLKRYLSSLAQSGPNYISTANIIRCIDISALSQSLVPIPQSFASPLITSRNNFRLSTAKAIILPSLSPPNPVESSLL